MSQCWGASLSGLTGFWLHEVKEIAAHTHQTQLVQILMMKNTIRFSGCWTTSRFNKNDCNHVTYHYPSLKNTSFRARHHNDKISQYFCCLASYYSYLHFLFQFFLKNKLNANILILIRKKKNKHLPKIFLTTVLASNSP